MVNGKRKRVTKYLVFQFIKQFNLIQQQMELQMEQQIQNLGINFSKHTPAA